MNKTLEEEAEQAEAARPIQRQDTYNYSDSFTNTNIHAKRYAEANKSIPRGGHGPIPENEKEDQNNSKP